MRLSYAMTKKVIIVSMATNYRQWIPFRLWIPTFWDGRN